MKTNIKKGRIQKLQSNNNPLHFLDWENNPPSVENLPAIITCNGISVLPKWRYIASNGMVDYTNWKPYDGMSGSVLTYTDAVGTDPILNAGSVLNGRLDDSIKFMKNNAIWKGTAADVALGTNDLILEVFHNTEDRSQNTVLLDAYVAASGNKGWRFEMGSYVPTFRTYGAGGTITSLGAEGGYMWHHYMVFLDRDDVNNSGSLHFGNGAQVGTGISHAGNAASFDNAGQVLSIGGTTPPGGGSNNFLSYAGLWTYPNWFNTSAAEWTTIAKQRFKQLYGFVERSGRIPYSSHFTSKTSTGNSFSIKFKNGQNRWWQITANQYPWPIRERLDNNKKNFIGVEVDANAGSGIAATLISGSKSGKVDVASSRILPPFFTSTVASDLTCFTGSTDSGVHGFSGSIANSGNRRTWGVLQIQPVNNNRKSWIKLEYDKNANLYAYYDLIRGEVGSTGSSCENAEIDKYAGGMCSCVMTGLYNSSGNIRCLVVNGNNDDVWVGDGSTADMAFTIGFSYSDKACYPTLVANATTETQIMYYSVGSYINGKKEGTLSYDVFNFSYLSGTGAYTFNNMTLTDGTTGNVSRIKLFISGSGFAGVQIFSASTVQTNIGGTTNIQDKKIHNLRLSWAPNDVKLYVDDRLEATSTTCNPPTNLNFLYISSGSHSDGSHRNIKLWDKANQS